jgi:hypothetical protein
MAISTLPTVVLKTRVPTSLGTIAAITAPLQFGLGDMSENFRGIVTIQAAGGAVTGPTWVLEGSLDQGATWFTIPANTTQPLVLTGQFSGDTAALFIGQYNVSGLSGGLFKFGATAGTGWTVTTVYALIG